MATSSSPENLYLSTEILLRIGRSCDQKTLSSFCRLSHANKETFTPSLYRHVILEEASDTPCLPSQRYVSRVPASLTAISDRTLSLARTLLTEPELCLMVQSLEISVSSALVPNAHDSLEGLPEPTLSWLETLEGDHVLNRAVATIVLLSEHLTMLKVKGLRGLHVLLSRALDESSPLDTLYYQSRDSTGESVTDFPHLPNLQNLLLAGFQDSEPDEIDRGDRFMGIKRLELTSTRIRAGLVDIVRACPELIGLKVEFAINENDEEFDFLQDLFEIATNLVHVHLDFYLDFSSGAPDRQPPKASIDVSALHQLDTFTVPLRWLAFNEFSAIGDVLPFSLTHLHGTHTSLWLSPEDAISRPGLTISASRRGDEREHIRYWRPSTCF